MGKTENEIIKTLESLAKEVKLQGDHLRMLIPEVQHIRDKLEEEFGEEWFEEPEEEEDDDDLDDEDEEDDDDLDDEDEEYVEDDDEEEPKPEPKK